MSKTVGTKSPSFRAIKADSLFLKASEQWALGKLRSAFRYFLASAKLGDAGAQHNVAYFYDVGVGMKSNRAKALYWYKRASRRGISGAAGNLGTIFRDDKNTKRALSWFKRAVSLGDADSNLQIAKMYLAINRNDERALVYLRRTIDAKGPDVTQASQENARRILNRVLRNAARTKKIDSERILNNRMAGD